MAKGNQTMSQKKAVKKATAPKARKKTAKKVQEVETPTVTGLLKQAARLMFVSDTVKGGMIRMAVVAVAAIVLF